MTYNCKILENSCLKGMYYRIRFSAPELCAEAQPGQFVHVRIVPLKDRILRRPFSICGFDVKNGILTLVYKVVGNGTETLAAMKPGEVCDIMGPLGNGYPVPSDSEQAVIIDGGFGTAATLPLAKRARNTPIVLVGARSEADVILTEAYEKAGCSVRIATQDGSVGRKGLVTELIPEALNDAKFTPVIYACGPNGMLNAVGKLAVKDGIKAYLSLDQHMCCGVGACFACVVKVKDESSPDGWRYSRSCKEGPVYLATEVYYG